MAMIGVTWHPYDKRFSGRYISDILSDISEPWCDRSPRNDIVGELELSIFEKDGFKIGGFFFGMNEENLSKIYSRPGIVLGSDASMRMPWACWGWAIRIGAPM